MSEQNPKSLMTFEDVVTDYLFFQEHITEIDEMRRHFAIHLLKMDYRKTPVRYLDFGCGDGGIPFALESEVPALCGKTQFGIVEPTEAQRNKAIEKLQKCSKWPVIAYDYLPETTPSSEESFDFILASHCLYYVPDLEKTLKSLIARMNNHSLFIIAMECSDSPTKKIWDVFFSGLNRPIPYHLSENVKATLEQLAIEYFIDPLEAEMEFEDTISNRRHVARFLLGKDYALQPEEKTLSFFDAFTSKGVVRAHMTNDLYVLKR